MKDTSPKERMLKKIRKALLEKRDNPYPNLEDLPLYEPLSDLPEIHFAEQLSMVAGKFIYCEN
jgi:L-lactate dehydrogenase complex protein LldG